MRVYLSDLGVFSEINKKEEITEHTFLLTDQEESMLRPIVNNEVVGKIWITKSGELKWSVRPTEDFDWNDDNKEWYLNEEKFNSRLEHERNQVWEKIKEIRLQHQSTGTYVESVGKWFHTDREALTNYNMIGHFINSNAYQPTQWKTMDNTFVEMNADLYQQVMLAIYVKGQHDFKNAEIHRARLWQSETPLGYDYSTGWSEGYNVINY